MKLETLLERNAITTRKSGGNKDAALYDILLNGRQSGLLLAKYQGAWLLYDFEDTLIGRYKTKREALGNTGLDWDLD